MRSWLTIGLATMYVPVWAAMRAAEQNALVKQYCAVCHTDAAMNGGLSLQHYDAAKRDPTLAAMILSKLNAGAMGAAGKGVLVYRFIKKYPFLQEPGKPSSGGPQAFH